MRTRCYTPRKQRLTGVLLTWGAQYIIIERIARQTNTEVARAPAAAAAAAAAAHQRRGNFREEAEAGIFSQVHVRVPDPDDQALYGTRPSPGNVSHSGQCKLCMVRMPPVTCKSCKYVLDHARVVRGFHRATCAKPYRSYRSSAPTDHLISVEIVDLSHDLPFLDHYATPPRVARKLGPGFILFGGSCD